MQTAVSDLPEFWPLPQDDRCYQRQPFSSNLNLLQYSVLVMIFTHSLVFLLCIWQHFLENRPLPGKNKHHFGHNDSDFTEYEIKPDSNLWLTLKSKSVHLFLKTAQKDFF